VNGAVRLRAAGCRLCKPVSDADKAGKGGHGSKIYDIIPKRFKYALYSCTTFYYRD
jgi:hypothetical protein